LLLNGLIVLAVVLCVLPVAMFLKNMKLFLPANRESLQLQKARSTPISVCIPARNEAKSIGAALSSLLASEHDDYEVLVLDDHSDDDTPSIVSDWMKKSDRVKLLQSPPLPEGWNGKQHACWQLANSAQHEFLLFLDADVRLSADALTRILAEQAVRDVSLLSGFPRQETGTFSEKLLIPMMHYVLLCYLPIDRMRASTDPGFAAGCGQLFLAKKSDYFACAGHSAIKGSRHDGIKLPRAFRKAGLSTDLFDATDLATCRMYESFGQVQRGLLKNATEGIANARLIGIFTILLLGGTILPIALFVTGLLQAWSPMLLIFLGLLSILSWIPRLIAASRFQQSGLGAACHPIAIVWFVGLQWIALSRECLGLKTRWRGRN
jgi:glycosyltransferase involved in cell wall biosynthesis